MLGSLSHVVLLVCVTAPGDYDAECRLDMERMDRLRSGEDESCFRAPRERRVTARRDGSTNERAFVASCRDAPDTARRKMLVNLRKDDHPVPDTRTARRKANKGM